MKVLRALQKKAIKTGLHYASKNPEKHLLKLLHFVRSFDLKNKHENTYNDLECMLLDRSNNWFRLVSTALKEINMHVMEKLAINFLLTSSLEKDEYRKLLSKKLGYSIPWAILMDPTSACNLHCKGCWAAEYGSKCSLSYDVLSRIVKEGKELGIYFYIFSGGEPLVRKQDILTLCREHNDCYFMAFTNGTLVDEEFATQMLSVGNFALAFSVEGFEEATDMRRGQGTYQKVMQAMDILKSHGLLFGFSTCYHKYNTEMVGSDEYIDAMIEKGARFAWYFTYMPVGKEADTDLLVTPDQREYMYRRMREIRATKPIFALDFWNDGEYVKGCIAGGREYIHINANGDVEPCAFIHYSNINIKDCSLKTALQQPLFKEYQKNQPFNCNHLRPCPLLDNPDCLKGMVLRSGAYSTELQNPEDVGELTDKCREAALKWGERADTLCMQCHHCNACKSGSCPIIDR